MTHLEPLAAEDLFKMQPGDTFRAYWEKDDNPDDVRLNYDVLVVASNEDDCILCLDPSWAFSKDEMTDDPSENMLDVCGRGYCYLYKTGPITSREMQTIINEAANSEQHRVQVVISNMYCGHCRASDGPRCTPCTVMYEVAMAIVSSEIME
jgi:hypothetical protein